MSKVQNDIYHEIVNSLKSDETIVFNDDIRKGTPFKPWISWAYDSYYSFRSNKYKDCEMLIYLEVAPKTPIYEIAKLNELTDRLLPWLDPIEKIEPKVIEKKGRFWGKERTVKPGMLVFKEQYNIPMTIEKSSQHITYPFSMCCIVDIQPNINFSRINSVNYDLDILPTNNWPMK